MKTPMVQASNEFIPTPAGALDSQKLRKRSHVVNQARDSKISETALTFRINSEKTLVFILITQTFLYEFQKGSLMSRTRPHGVQTMISADLI
jgi:hypothetical protein